MRKLNESVWVATECNGTIDASYWWRSPQSAQAFCDSRREVYPHLPGLQPKKLRFYKGYTPLEAYTGALMVVRNPQNLRIPQWVVPMNDALHGSWWNYPAWWCVTKPLQLYLPLK